MNGCPSSRPTRPSGSSYSIVSSNRQASGPWNHPVDVLPETERACDLHIGETAAVPIVPVLELPPQSKRPGTHQQRNAGAIVDATFVSEHTHRFPRRGQSLKRARGFMPVKDGVGRRRYQGAGPEGDVGGVRDGHYPLAGNIRSHRVSRASQQALRGTTGTSVVDPVRGRPERFARVCPDLVQPVVDQLGVPQGSPRNARKPWKERRRAGDVRVVAGLRRLQALSSSVTPDTRINKKVMRAGLSMVSHPFGVAAAIAYTPHHNAASPK